MRKTIAVAVLALLAPTLAACGDAAPAAGRLAAEPVGSSEQRADRRTGPESAAARVPALRVSTRVANLNHPWDVVQLPSKSLLITERDPARLTLSKPGGARRTVAFPTAKVFTSGETGLLGLEIDPAFKQNRRFYTCSGWNLGGDRHEVRVNAWTLSRDETRARLAAPLVTGIQATSGRHGGCRLLIAKNGSLHVGTGDAAVGTNPRDLTSLGGKTLRVNRFTGRAWPGNPFPRAERRAKRLVFTFGHRNVQGMAQRDDGTVWSIEHGSFRDDEVNRLVRGGDYGWNPVPGYNEEVPMTDQSLPGKQYAARWRSGDPTVAPGGGTFVYGKRWGALNGSLAVALLKDEELLFMAFGPKGFNPTVRKPAALDGRFGRLRTVVRLQTGNLLVTTDADGGQGRVLLVRPR